MLHDYEMDNRYDEVKEWYDGYRFGNVDVYCPWDVINYCDEHLDDPSAKPRNYWSNTSGNDIIQHFITDIYSGRDTAKAELERIRSEIISGKMTFADAALKYSKDYLSGANGGSLGYAFPEAYVGPFAKMVETTPQGTISAPFKSEFGWHILEVTGSRDGDKTEDAYRQKAYEQIVNSQLQDATKDWVKALRKNADIQYFDK